MSPPAIIDAWANIAPPGTLDDSGGIARLFKQAGRDDLLREGVDAETMIGSMDQAGVQQAVVTVWHQGESWKTSNREVLGAVKQFPERIVGVAAVDLDHPIKAVEGLKRAVELWGFRAMRLVPWLWNRPPNDKLYYPLCTACVELGIPVCTQVGHTGPLAPSETGRPIPYLEEVANDFPDLSIVGGHLGYPWVDEMIALASTYPNVYIDTSAHLPRYYPPTLIDFMKHDGQQKVLFATNYPMLEFKRCVDQVEQLELPADVREDFLSNNARRVYGLD